MVDKNLKLLKNGATHLRDNGDVKFYLSARALYSRGARDSKIGKKWPESSSILDYILS